MGLANFFLIWFSAILVVVLSTPESPMKFHVFCKRSPLFIWFWGLQTIVLLYLIVGYQQVNVGCGFLGECYSEDLPGGHLLLKMTLGILANIWLISVTIRGTYVAFGRVLMWVKNR